MASRLKREECKRTKHDSDFSKWQVLIGPTDWEDHALGKDGVERYRIHNLPQCSSCPGLYELGISNIPREGRTSRGRTSDGIVVVYLGQADKVRGRLQQYGRAGSHLERSIPSGYANNNEDLCLIKGPGLFKEVFSKGYSILFRWSPMLDKTEAEKTESKLLNTFDYAWNTRANGASRREDVLMKIHSTMTGQPIPNIPKNLHEWKQLIFNKKEGIKISGSVPPDKLGSSNYLERYLIPSVRKVSRSQPRPNEGGEIPNSEHDICGVANGDGSICRRKPVIRNKKCMLHEGKSVNLTGNITSKEVLSSIYNSSLTSLPLKDGSLGMELPGNGTRQCKEPRGLCPIEKLKAKDESLDAKHDQICGVLLRDGNVCRSKPSQGRKRCEDHKGMRIAGTTLMTTRECLGKVKSSDDRELDPCEEYEICGVFLGDGNVCQSKPFRGRLRCEDHKGMKVNGIASRIARECSITNGLSYAGELDPCQGNQICGVLLGDGNVCTSKPPRGRKRCEDHKGMRVNGILSWTTGECSVTKQVPYVTKLYSCEGYQTCGVLLANGNVCQRMPLRGRKRCENHKGMRITY